MKDKRKRIPRQRLTALELEFLQHSNWIEEEYSKDAFKDAQLAWAYAKNFKDTLNVTHVLHIHKILMGRLRPDIAGRVRDCAVWIGGELKPAKSRFILEQDIDNWLHSSYFHEASPAKLSHVAFERIHPFEDGNGRVGRILYNLERLKDGEDIHVIHQGDEQLEYYTWFSTTKTGMRSAKMPSSARLVESIADRNISHPITSNTEDMETSVSGYAQNVTQRSTTTRHGHTRKDF